MEASGGPVCFLLEEYATKDGGGLRETETAGAGSQVPLPGADALTRLQVSMPNTLI
jgi:hypothetical protein